MRNKLWLIGTTFVVAILVLNRGPDKPDPEASPPGRHAPPDKSGHEKERSLFGHDGLIQQSPTLNTVIRITTPLAAEVVSAIGLPGLTSDDTAIATVQKQGERFGTQLATTFACISPVARSLGLRSGEGGVRYGAELATTFTFNSAIGAVLKGGLGFGRDSAGF